MTEAQGINNYVGIPRLDGRNTLTPIAIPTPCSPPFSAAAHNPNAAVFVAEKDHSQSALVMKSIPTLLGAMFLPALSLPGLRGIG